MTNSRRRSYDVDYDSRVSVSIVDIIIILANNYVSDKLKQRNEHRVKATLKSKKQAKVNVLIKSVYKSAAIAFQIFSRHNSYIYSYHYHFEVEAIIETRFTAQ